MGNFFIMLLRKKDSPDKNVLNDLKTKMQPSFIKMFQSSKIMYFAQE